MRLPVLLSLGVLTLTPVSQAVYTATQLAEVRYGNTTYHATLTEVTAERGGTVVWRQAAPMPTATKNSFFVVDGAVVLLSEERNAHLGNTAQLTAFNADKGRLRWQKTLYARYGNEANFSGEAGNAVLLQICGGEPGHCGVTAYNLYTGKERWSGPYDGNLLYRHGDLLLFLDFGLGGSKVFDARAFTLVRVNAQTNHVSEATYSIAPRKSQRCGDMIVWDEGLKFTAQYVYAIRRDACGTFVARFDWHKGADQKPLVYPKP